MNQPKGPRVPNVDKRKIMKRVIENIGTAEKKPHSNARAGGDDVTKEDKKVTNAQKHHNAQRETTLKPELEVEDEDTQYDDEKDSPFKQVPTLRVTKRDGNFRVMFQPIRVTQHEAPLLPVVFLTPNEWSDEEGGVSSDDSELDVEYMAPAAFMPQGVKAKPLLLMMKQLYDYSEVEKRVAEEEARVKEKEKNKKQRDV